MSVTNDLSRLANNANVLVNSITVNSTAITSVNVAGITINSSGYTGDANNAAYLGGSSLSTIQGQITSNASAAYSNSVSYTDTKIGTANSAITGNAATAYSNAVSYTDTKIGTANTAMVANASAAYTNAITFASNASNVNTGTLAEARLPYRMNQNVRTSDSVEFNGMTLTGNLVVSGNVNIIGANNLSVSDNMIYLNSNNDVTNPDIGIGGNYNDGSYAHTGIFRDATDGIWKVFDNYTPEPDASVYIDTSNTSFHLANFQANTLYGGNTSTNWFIANTAGVYATGTINAASHTVGTSTIANSTGVYTGIVNAASHTVGTSFTANSTLVNAYALVVATNTATIGTAAYYVANGNFGIGTSSPIYQLQTSSTLGVGTYGTPTTGTGWRLNTTTMYGQYNATDKILLNVNGDSWFNSSNVGIGITTPAGKLEVNGQINTRNSGGYTMKSINGSNWGYSTGYKCVVIGSNSTGDSTSIAFNYDPSINPNGAFQGDGRELIFRNYTRFVTPVANNNGFNLQNLVLSDGSVGIGSDPSYKLHIAGTGYASSDFRAPIFYDSDNTSYYVDPTSTSSFVGVRSGRIALRDDSVEQFSDASDSVGLAINYAGYAGGYTYFRNFNVYNGKGGSLISSSGSGTYTTIFGSTRSPIFYDSDNTSYYCDPSSSSAFNSAILIGPNSSGRYTRIGGNGGATDEATLSASNGNLHIDCKYGFDTYINYYTNGIVRLAEGGAYTYSAGSMRSPLFYDSQDTGYYCDPNSTSLLFRLNVNGSSIATNGWTRLVNGMIMQWGITGSTGTGAFTVTFPLAFPNACYFATYLPVSLNPVGQSAPNISATSTTTFTGSNSTGITNTFRWFAIGY